GLLLLSPLFALLALWIKRDSPGPVFHRGTRVGKNGRPFQILKFRSMVVNAAAAGPGITASGDPRVTRSGRFLRKTKLDELPQLVNVLRGEMSLVGPRPEDPRYVARYTPAQRRILSVRPGITSLASVAYRDEEALLAGGDLDQIYTQVVMPAKLEIDLAYLDQMSLWTDLRILALTVWAVFGKRMSGKHAR
ncbi:MAG: sugar transferase, partial [Armatimonadetes bacterium]|nr:sugar transferase [Armatimonadota bacterium]